MKNLLKLLAGVLCMVMLLGNTSCQDQIVPDTVAVDIGITEKSYRLSSDLKFDTFINGAWTVATATDRACIDEILYDVITDPDGTVNNTVVTGSDGLSATCIFPADTIVDFVPNMLPVYD